MTVAVRYKGVGYLVILLQGEFMGVTPGTNKGRGVDEPMSIMERATIIHYHRHRMTLYGPGTARALGWKEEASQQKRFAVLATVGALAGCSLLDVGCGCGGLKAYLDRTHTGFTYIGIDQQPEFIATARARYHDVQNTWFFQTDFTTVAFPSVDYVLASGSLNYRSGDPQFPVGMIEKMLAAAARAVAFNILDAARFPQHDLLGGHDLARIEMHCKSLTPHVRIIRGYLDDNCTIFLYKAPTGTGQISDEPAPHRTHAATPTMIRRDGR